MTISKITFVFGMPQLKISISQSYSDTTVTDSLFFLSAAQKRQSKTEVKPVFSSNYWISLKAAQELPPKEFESRTFHSPTVLFFTFIFILFSWGYYYQKHAKGLRSIVSSFFNSSTFFNELNDRSGANGFVSLGMFLLGIVNLTVFGYQLLGELRVPFLLFDFNNTALTLLIIGFSIILGLFLKTILVLLSGVIFNASNTFQAYLSLIIISIQITGIVLFPFTVLHTYALDLNPQLITFTGLTGMMLIYFYRLLRSFILGVKQSKGQVFHIILYICTLEILPLLVLGRIAFQNQWI